MVGKQLNVDAVPVLTELLERFSALADWQQDMIHEVIHATVEQLGIKMGKVAMPLRMAVTGGTPSPGLDLTLYLVGQGRTLKRIEMALAYINKSAAGT